MRIPPTKIWLAAALTLGMGVARGDSQPALVFSNQSFENFRSYKNSSVLVLATLEHDIVGALVPTPRTFAWRTNDQSIQIKEVNLYALDEATKGKGEPIGDVIAAGQENRKPDGNESNLDTPAFDPTLLPSQPTTTSPGGGDVHPRAFPLSARQTGSIPPSQGKIGLAVSWSATGGSVTIDDITQLAVYSKATLFFGVQWVGNTSDSGETYSGAFAVVNNEKEAFEITRDSNSLYLSYASPVLEESRPSKAKPPYLPYPSSVTPTAKPSGISESASNESQSGLATGAIIGIAVACGILGLLLVLGAIWFLIRRRSKQAGNTNFGSPGRPYGTERSRTDDLIAEKEASAGGADPSPHSPYSDDGVVLVPSAGRASTYHNGGPNGSVVLGTPAAAPMLPPQIPRIPHQDHHHEQVGPYATYSDRGSIGALGGGGGPPSTHAASITHSIHDETNRAGMGSPTAGRVTPHSVLAPQYAHLVEEGMTEDEIRRLEDEERQLDAEIERAGRR